ncbi:MAG TPA: PspA/IM30 family protein [Acidimicrobiales bacterium]|nr:PspA/IM30 family protein [Acidimicrobiales bacterium]
MWRTIKKWWHNLWGKAEAKVDASADPTVQLNEAIRDAQTQHRELTEQAAAVIANQKQAEMRLNSKLAEMEKLNANARQALKMSADAQTTGDAAKAQQYNVAAESIATQLIAVEKDIEDLKSTVLESTQAAGQAKQAVQNNSRRLQEKLAEKNKLLSKLDQAKMQEQLNKAMGSLTATVGDELPSFDEIKDKIEARYAKAKGMSELQEESVEGRMAEIEAASANVEAQSRLEQMKAELGLAPAPAVEAPAPAPAPSEQPPATPA